MTTPVALGGLGKRENEFQAQDFKYTSRYPYAFATNSH